MIHIFPQNMSIEAVNNETLCHKNYFTGDKNITIIYKYFNNLQLKFKINSYSVNSTDTVNFHLSITFGLNKTLCYTVFLLA